MNNDEINHIRDSLAKINRFSALGTMSEHNMEGHIFKRINDEALALRRYCDDLEKISKNEIPAIDEQTLKFKIAKAMSSSKVLGMIDYMDEAVKSIMEIIRPYLREPKEIPDNRSGEGVLM